MSAGSVHRGVARGNASTPGLSASPPSRAKLPRHFAASFEYRGENTASPSQAILHDDSTSKPSPRRSPRARQERFANLLLADSDIDDDDELYQPKSRSAWPSKRHMKKVTEESSSSEGVDSRSQDRGKKPRSRKRIRRTRDDPNSAAGSIYAHLNGVPDLFAEYNDIMFCGINPGVKSSSSGHHFAHRSNHFYPSLHLAGITEQRMKPEQDVEFPSLSPYSLGLTNLAPRPTAEGNELLPSELIDGVPILLEKILRWKPRTVCFVGKGISEAFIKGLKQAGAVNQPSSAKKGRSTQKLSSQRIVTVSDRDIKLEDSEPRLAASSIGSEHDKQPAFTRLRVAIPAGILCAFAASAEDSKDAKPLKGTSSQRKKQLYSKGNSKDDTGYGILPICVPHSSSRGTSPSLDDVTLFYVTPSSSARVTTHFLDDKARILKSLRRLIQYLRDTEHTAPRLSDGNFGRPEGCGRHSSPGIKLETENSVADEAYVLLPAQGPDSTIDLEVVDLSRFTLSSADRSKK